MQSPEQMAGGRVRYLVVVVGAGLDGMTVALELAARRIKVVVGLRHAA